MVGIAVNALIRPALYLRERERDPAVADRIHERLSWNGGARNASGTGLAAVDWEGRVKPDQFWGGDDLGSVCERPLSQIWTDPPEQLTRLRRRSDNLTGRCAGCRFLDLCGGGLASRALASGAGMEGSDPGCHLTDAEIAPAARPIPCRRSMFAAGRLSGSKGQRRVGLTPMPRSVT